MVPVTDKHRPAEGAIDLVIYAPLGFVLEARKLLPTFVERGRQQVQMAKVIGKFAVKQGQSEASKHLSGAQEQAVVLLGELGLVDQRSGARPADASSPTPVPEIVKPLSVATDRPEPAAESDPMAEPEPAPARPQSGTQADDLAIAEYDSLAASHVIPRLSGLTTTQLEAVRSYESSHRSRKTILGKIAQLQGA